MPHWTRLVSCIIGTAALLVCGELHAGVVTATNSTDGFFDNTSSTRTFTFNLADFGGGSTTVADVDISIFFAKSNDSSFVPEGGTISPGFPFLREIEFVLTSPAGTSFTLISNAGDTELVPADSFASFGIGSNGFKGTILFDQSAANPVDVNPNVLSAGTFRPDDDTLNSLDIFNGESAVGTWSLFIEDDAGGQVLSFYEATLKITTEASTSVVPEPSSIALLVIGACCATAVAFRRKVSSNRRNRSMA